MRSVNRHSEFLPQCFEVLFGGLLAKKPGLIAGEWSNLQEASSRAVIGFRLSHPLGGHLFHRVPCRAPQFRGETNPPSARDCSSSLASAPEDREQTPVRHRLPQ